MRSFTEYSALAEQTLRDKKYPGGEIETLYGPIDYALSAGGKRLRPALALMAADAFGGNPDEAMKAAIGLEIFHNFTLLHDDVMDNSDTRRGRQSVHAKWDVNTAILSGDTMLTQAAMMVSEVPDDKLRKVLDAFNAMAIKVYEGQRLDMDFESREDVDREEYIKMIMAKTGALLGTSVMIGAMIGGASDEDAGRMYEYGMMLGIAFQIQDDWLDVFGDSNTFGKPIGGDINNNKKSFLMLSGLAMEGADGAALREAIKLPAGETKVKVVTRLYEKMGISDVCKKEIAHYCSKALTALKKVKISEEDKEPFRKLLEKLTGRKK